MRLLSKRFLFALFAMLPFQFAYAESVIENPNFTPRSARVGLSYNLQTADPFEGASSSGVGFVGAYEFNLNPRFTLGMNLEYRHFPGDDRVGQLGYGLLLKHALKQSGAIRPYLEYGLLLNVTRQAGRSSAGTAHDTRLAAGVDFEVCERSYFADLAYHYSRIGYFDEPSINVDYVQLSLGMRFGWGSR